MMSAVRHNVVFDLGGVLFDWNPDKILARRPRPQAERDLLRQAVFRHQDWLDFDRGTLLEPAAIRRFSERTGIQPAEIAQFLQDVRESLTPLEQTWDLLRDLKRSGNPLYCLSNIAVSTFEHLQRNYPRWDLFDGVVISGSIGLLKPEREIFDHTIERFLLDRSRTVFIDDLEPNVAGARQAGWQAIRFIDAEDCRRRLAELRIGGL